LRCLKEDYILLSGEYKNNKTKLKTICPNKHTHITRYDNWVHGFRCHLCKVAKFTKQNAPMWKGGVSYSNLPLFETYAGRLSKYTNEHLVYEDGLELMAVNCTFCGTIFVPSRRSIQSRLLAINSAIGGDSNFYCSDKCKKDCPTFGQVKYPKDFKVGTNYRYDQKAWAKLVKERDNYTCQICGAKEVAVLAHHIDPVSNNAIESADTDNGVTLCKTCHKKAHKLPGCSYRELRCK